MGDMGRILDVAERLLRGEATTLAQHPFTPLGDLEEVAPGVAFVSSFANATAIATGEGLVLVDTGSFFFAGQVYALVRRFSTAPLHTAVFTHGHVDHVFGVERYEAEPRPPGTPPVRVVAHEGVPRRFARYRLTAGWNACINARQFRVATPWPVSYRQPDVTYAEALTLEIGGESFELRHARGETDDATWVWVPSRRVLCTGDLFIWAAPNAGNPQKVQRYPGEWARALREMERLGAEVLCPGHGWPIVGAARVKEALSDTAELLETLHDRTVALMNEGATLETILHEVKAPPHLLEKPYLRPVYDDPEFIVRNVWRLYGGWWDGDPAELKPAPRAALAAELAALAGGASRLAARARELFAAGDLALACHLVELAARAAPTDEAVTALRREIYRARAEAEPSLMARGIFSAAAEERPARRPDGGRREGDAP